ncbi:hypothetical protein GCM10023185_23430 [Hymenobacter saemangeumensis]|uniref:Uncharacterized protein n=2 Tax=Hymenobacter saemangeumensis TaxID=1084522 RepID=A0ABP8IG07_9BACT
MPDAGKDYYPLEAGTYRIYNVTDSTYRQHILQPVERYQIRESIAATDAFTDAAGNKAYRVVRSRRIPAVSMNWEADSVYVLTGTSQTVSLVRNNRRTVELIFPVREGRTWNMHAFTSSGGDTITNQNRVFRNLGQSFSLTTATTGVPAVTKVYPETVTVDDTGDEHTANDACYLRTYRQIFAKGVGPVLRYRRNFSYAPPTTGTCERSTGRVFFGTSRHEALVEYGR